MLEMWVGNKKRTRPTMKNKATIDCGFVLAKSVWLGKASKVNQ